MHLQTSGILTSIFCTLLIAMSTPRGPHTQFQNQVNLTTTQPITELLASRISYIPLLIHADQLGFIPKHQMSDGARKILDLIQWTEFHKMPSLLLSLDAFDKVHWSYLNLVLQKFGFTGNINTAILALYLHPSARVWTSGITSDPFTIPNGTRQGCPLCLLIVALVIKPPQSSHKSPPKDIRTTDSRYYTQIRTIRG